MTGKGEGVLSPKECCEGFWWMGYAMLQSCRDICKKSYMELFFTRPLRTPMQVAR